MSWYNTNWQRRIKLTVLSTSIFDDETDFIVHVKMSRLPASFWTNVHSTGKDIRITKSDGTTEQAFELVFIDTANNKGELYFKASSLLSASNTDFYLYYDNDSATAYAATDTYGRNNVWTDYAFVHHFNATSDVDSSGNVSGSATIETNVSAAAGLFGDGNGLDKTDSASTAAMTFAHNSGLDGVEFVYTSFWVNAVDIYGAADSRTYPWLQTAADPNRGVYTVWWSTNGPRTYSFYDNSGIDRGEILHNSGIVKNNTLYYITKGMRLDTESGNFYVNNSTYSTGKTEHGLGLGSVTPTNSADFRVWSHCEGKIDELRIKTSVTSHNRHKSEYANMGDPTNFMTIGTEELQPTAPPFKPQIFYFM